jgi:tRNA(Ile)-lysidine synthase
LLRAGRGSGVDGLAAMAPRLSAHGLILVRPLLSVPRARLEATLRSEGQAWIEDPSNRDPAYARTKVRLAMAMLAPQGLAARRFAETAGRMARVRAALEAATDALIRQAVAPYAAGYCLVAVAPLVQAADEVALRALARVLMAVGGADLPPRLVRLERLLDAIRTAKIGRGKTLLGCRILPWRASLLVCREAAALAPPMVLRPGAAEFWDGRFRVVLKKNAIKGLTVAALGEAGRELSANSAESIWADLPAPARPALPSLWHRGRVVAVPAIGWVRPGSAGKNAGFRAEFAPTRLLPAADGG